MKKIQINMSLLLLFLGVVAFSVPAFAQNELNFDCVEKKKRGDAKEKYVLLTDAVNNSQFDQAKEPLNWILENAPCLHADVYVKGVTMYEKLAKKAGEDGNTTDQQAHYAKIENLYKMRIENKLVKDMVELRHRFGRDAYFFWKDDKSKTDTLYNFYKKNYEMDKDNFPRSEVIYYADASGKFYQKEGISLDEMTAIYKELKAYTNKRINEAQDEAEKKKWREYVLTKIDDLELIYFPKDCNRISEIFGEKLKENPNDTLLVQKVIKLMGDNGCTKEPLFLEVMTKFYDMQPSAAVASTIGQLHMAGGNTDAAIKWTEKSLEGASAEAKQKAANTILTLSKLSYKDGKYSKARTLALKAANMSGGGSVAANAYSFVGDLYMTTYKKCMDGSDIIEKRAVFLAAYDMYAKGGSSAKMASAKKQFPSKEDIFTSKKYKVGSSVKVGCWINTTTTVRAR